MLINARITKRSFKKWKFFSSTAQKLFKNFDVCLSSSLESKKYLKLLGAKNISYIGNLKFTQSEKKTNELNDNIKKFFLTRKIWCASSTHELEEKICANTHKKLKTKYENLLTVIIPRHIDRTIEIVKQIKENEEILQKYLGADFKPKGFFLPEMAYGDNVGEIIKSLGYEWMILDEIADDRDASALVLGLEYNMQNLRYIYAYGDFDGKENTTGTAVHIVEQNFGVEYTLNDVFTLASIYVKQEDKHNSAKTENDWDKIQVMLAYNF
jgi:alpha-amylase/alpha-mannosidase (GH57 family)